LLPVNSIPRKLQLLKDGIHGAAVGVRDDGPAPFSQRTHPLLPRPPPPRIIHVGVIPSIQASQQAVRSSTQCPRSGQQFLCNELEHAALEAVTLGEALDTLHHAEVNLLALGTFCTVTLQPGVLQGLLSSGTLAGIPAGNRQAKKGLARGDYADLNTITSSKHALRQPEGNLAQTDPTNLRRGLVPLPHWLSSHC
jgi:hypothetical protein